MESIDSSPDCLEATSRFGARKEDSAGGSECGEDISASSSTGKSTSKGPCCSQKLKNTGIKYRSNNKKTLKNCGVVRSFKRRTKTRLIQSSAAVESDDDATASQSGSLLDSSASLPNYLMATSSSQGKKTNSNLSPRYSEPPFDSSDKNSSPILQSKSGSPKPLQTLSRDSSFKGLRFLVKKASFKPRKTGLKRSVVSEDVSVHRATYSSTIKDSKFHEPVEIHGRTESNKLSAMKVCRYHHCSLHGHRDGDHDSAPPPKRSLFRRKWSMKRQRSMRPKTESCHGAKECIDGKKELPDIRIAALVESSNRESINNGVAFSGDGNKNVSSYAEIHAEPESKLVGDGDDSISESGLIELAFGESSFPDRSYQESVDILRKYTYEVHDFGGAPFWLNGRCLNCSCHNQSHVMSIPRSAGAETSQSESTSSSPENVYKDGISQHVVGPSSSFSEPDKEVGYPVEDSPTLKCANGEDHPVTPVTAEVTENNSASYLSSDSRTSSHINSDEDGHIKTESTIVGEYQVGEALQDSVAYSPVINRVKLQFSKRSHISMWHLIHQHMSTNMTVEPTDKPLDQAGESSTDDGNTLVAKEISTSNAESDSRADVENNQPESQDIEVRKLFAIKLVREAIEKILLPEVQDQASDDQSISSASTPCPEIIEKNQTQGVKQDDNGDSDADIGTAYTASNPVEESHTKNKASPPEVKETEKTAESKSEKKAPKHWGYLKKWFLLQRFIKALEKVRKFNPRKPQPLPLYPDPEAEKVNLRPQTVDERKNAEEWMLDYALRQAVGQLAPTQKKKVSLLIQAFETVVPSQEEIHYRSPRLENNSINSIAAKTSKFVSEDLDSKSVKSSPKVQISTLHDDVKSRALESTLHPASHSDSVNLEKIVACGSEQEARPKSQGLHEIAASDCIQEKVKGSGESSIQLDRNTHIKMWHMVYRHVISDIAEKVGSQLLDGSEDHDGSEENKSHAVNEGNHALDFPKLSDKSSNLRSSFTKSDILKLVKDAVDGILLRDIQDDSSDTQSVSNDSIADLDISESNFSEIEGLHVSNEGEKTEPQSQAKKKFELSKSKNWSKVKKLVLLKRSIRALEKARNMKTLKRDLAPQMPDPKSEKIELRTQMIDERKKAEQWMLDYAVQHIVTKLTPARKKRVSMLVEAFEAVVPFPET